MYIKELSSILIFLWSVSLILTKSLFSLANYKDLCQITSCVPNVRKCGGTGGCKGNIEDNAYDYMKIIGVSTDKQYPYDNKNGGFTGMKFYRKNSINYG